MNLLDKISDKEFIPFLQSLGVDTRNQSFEWMLNNPEFAPALEWMYYNLDCNNVLTLREKRRYSEIQKNSTQLVEEATRDKLMENIEDIKAQYPRICLPGETEQIENVKHDITAEKEKLNFLEKQDGIVRDLIKQNELNNDLLNVQITKIHAAQQQATEEEKISANNCKQLVREIDCLMDEVVVAVSRNIDIYATCGNNKESAQKFFTFGPFDQYKQTQDLFQSHFDLYAAQKFHNRANDVSDDRSVLIEAKRVEGRLSDAMSAYIESKSELTSETSKLELVTNYEHPHGSQIGIKIMEAQTAVQLLNQEESILEVQLKNAIKGFVEERTNTVEFLVMKAALDVRQEIQNDLTYLLEMTQQALALDTVLYSVLRHELFTIEEFLLFASMLRQYIVEEHECVASRVDSMREICNQQYMREKNQYSQDTLLKCLHRLLGVEMPNECSLLVSKFNKLKERVKELKNDIEEEYLKQEDALQKFAESTKPLQEYIWDGCTKQPNCSDKTVTALTHNLQQNMNKIDERILDSSAQYNSVKNGDKLHLRKLWQWFLTDPSKLFAAIKAAQSGKLGLNN